MRDSDEDYEYDSGEDSQAGYLSEEEVPNSERQTKTQAYTVITPVQLAHSQESDIEAVTGILGCTRSTARKLLIENRWDKEALFGALAEKGEERVFSAAGVSLWPAENMTLAAEGEVSCGTCFCDVPAAEATAMDCGHSFCNDCWHHHFKVQVGEGRSRRIKCMAVKCGMHCEEEKVFKLLGSDEGLLGKYRQCLLASYVEDNAKVCWCPSVPHCGNAVRVEPDPHCEPTCSCGHKFCFSCMDEPHSPCTCEMWKRWREKCQDDSETKNWMTANTKACPKCGKPVEKNGGCNLVVCNCGQSFCWLCGAATGRSHTWTAIEGHSCGRYKEDMDKKIDEAGRSVKRYHHYFTRWEAHAKSAKMEAEQRARIHAKIAVLEQGQSTLKDYTWLLQALDQLFEARRILGYTYPFAFYMFGNSMFKEEISAEQNTINQNLFENQQQQMESLVRLAEVVEHLSSLVNLSPEHTEAVEDANRLQVINHTVNLDKRLRKLYELIENDLMGSLMFSPNDIAPFKGCTSQNQTIWSQANLLELAADAEDEDDVIDLTTSATPSPSSGNGKRARLDSQR